MFTILDGQSARRIALGLLLVVFPALTWAIDSSPGSTPPPDGTTLTLQQALAYTLERHPELSQFPYRQRAADARALQAGLSPNPELSLEVENVAGSGRFSGTDSAEASLVLSQLIELGGKQASREKVARYQREMVDSDYDLMRWQVLAETVRRFLAVASAQEAQRLAELSLSLTRESRDVSRRLATAGAANEASLQRSIIAVSRAEVAVFESEQRLAAARVSLAVQWGDTEPRYTKVAADLYQRVPLPGFSEVRENLKRAPELMRFVTERRLREAELQLAQAQGRQDLRVGIGIKQIQESDDQALTFSLSMPLGFRNRNQGAIAASQAEFEQLTLEEQATRIQLMARLQQVYQQLEMFRKTVTLLQSDALPAARKSLASITKGYEQGRYSYLELAEARRERIAVERDALQAATDFYQTLVTLEQLVGRGLAGPWPIEPNRSFSATELQGDS
ncbi:TolC family protein [Marinimicrobium sp. ARAG 43.8]|uniref:TolC family protein n=1 Tax=Marinimicrobium sp. ARAG 43.8 TaxID=3418719 RepID=UPI003CFA75C9